MARLHRPHIPVTVKAKVAARQLFTMGIVSAYEDVKPLGLRVEHMLLMLAGMFGCERRDLRLDHDPPLAARYRTSHYVRGKTVTVYDPPANSADHLAYRPHGAQFDGSHDVKTRIRGEHGQYSDLALIKRARRRERPPKPKKKWASRPMEKSSKSRWPKRSFSSKKSPERKP